MNSDRRQPTAFPSLVARFGNLASRPLYPESTLSQLPLHTSSIAITELGADLAAKFEQSPTLPGVLLMTTTVADDTASANGDNCVDMGECVGMVSRQQFLEYLLRPQGLELFLPQPLSLLHHYTRHQILVLSSETTILSAAPQALRRSPELVGEPIVVRLPDGQYRLLDFHDLNIAYWQLRGIETQVWYEKTHLEMLRHNRMASLGRLVDGVSHEILDPVSFIWGNLSHLKDYIRDLVGLLDHYETHTPNPPAALQAYREEIEFDYLREDIPRTLTSIKTGADRLSKLATSLQNFCHIDEVYPKPANIHECIEGVLLLLKSRLNSEIEIIKDYGHLPPLPCFIGQLSQVFMNILTQAVNGLLYIAATAEIASEFGTVPSIESGHFRPQIVIRTASCSIDGSGHRWISVWIGHNAPTVAEELQAQIAKGFVDSKPLTQETELSNSYRIITAKHRGHFRVHCAPAADQPLDDGMTTAFEILLPLT
jgi:signal transduction histidine kinase